MTERSASLIRIVDLLGRGHSRDVDRTRLIERLRALQDVSDLTQKEAAAAAGITPGGVGYWLRGTPPSLEKLAAYVKALGGELIIEMWHPKEDRRPIVTSQAGADAAQAIDAMSETQRQAVLRLLRDAPYMTRGDWRGLEGMLVSIEADIDFTPSPRPRHPEP